MKIYTLNALRHITIAVVITPVTVKMTGNSVFSTAYAAI
jgi:hypothetical protein